MLNPYQDQLFFIPGHELQPISFDMILQEVVGSSKDNKEYTSLELKHERINVLKVKNSDGEYKKYEAGSSRLSLPTTYSELIKELKSKIEIPDHLIKFKTNIHVDESTKIMSSYRIVVKK